MRLSARLIVFAMIGVASIAASSRDAFQNVVDALSTGEQNARARLRSANILAASGASPAKGTEDLVRRWNPEGAGPAYRDRVLGAVYQRLILAPQAHARFEQTFFAGQSAHVAVVPLDKTPFALRIIDDDGQSRCAAPRALRCDWVPAWTSRFRIELENNGRKSGRFYLVMQ